ncbi:MAG: GIY-YIG nuclease family protein [Algoriphagus sp.]|uniref:GIY-YIG nuclease family protein n=1 Tax=Algoriphagus sp. TaxID=1872435 RepID=UPI002601624A|nr:GIY-YIG nuclease family protein [Algoriphagus sp.]MDG1278697.1 GIY-YIG nuclease family protein [Algoriphagus sp.]
MARGSSRETEMFTFFRVIVVSFLNHFYMLIHFVYILYSEQTDKYYIGQTEDLDRRLMEHNSHSYQDSYTKIASDWKMKINLKCSSKRQAIKIENHIKKNRSRKYVEDFIRFPEIGQNLLVKYLEENQ